MTAVLLRDGTVAGSIVDPVEGMVHKFMGQDSGELRFESVRSADFPDEPTGETSEQDLDEDEPDDRKQVSEETDWSVIDVMVVWNKVVECAAAGQPADCKVSSSTKSSIMATVHLAVEETNVAFVRSAINAELRLVHAYLDEETENGGMGLSTHLFCLQSTCAGTAYKDVPAKREQYGADVVVALIEDPVHCGQAYVGPNKRNMYSVTVRRCATGQYVFGHEIAHNLGCKHDREAERACDSPNSNYGWKAPDASFSDILSYPCWGGGCMGTPVGSCTRMQFFSNPDMQYRGQPTGRSGVADLAKQINAVRAEVAAYYDGPSSPIPAPPTSTPSTPRRRLAGRLEE